MVIWLRRNPPTDNRGAADRMSPRKAWLPRASNRSVALSRSSERPSQAEAHTQAHADLRRHETPDNAGKRLAKSGVVAIKSLLLFLHVVHASWTLSGLLLTPNHCDPI